MSAHVTKEKLEAFVVALQDQQTAHYGNTYKSLKPPVIYAENGSKYIRIVTAETGSRSVFCFIEKSTGNILKAASWKAPAKHARGNIHTATHGIEFLGPYGAAYLR